MEVCNKFGSVSEFGSEYPQSLFVSAFISCPTDKIQEFAGAMAIVDFGVQDFGYLELGFIIDSDGWWGWLNLVRDWVQKCWFQHRDVKNRVYSVETVQKLQGDQMGTRVCQDLV